MRSERDIAAERIVVTGATGGIGKEIARALISRGALLTLVARDADKAAATAAELAAEPGAEQAPAIVMCDLADLSSVRAAAQELHDRYDGIDVLVANAGMRSFQSRTTTDGFEQMMATNHPQTNVERFIRTLLGGRPMARSIATAASARQPLTIALVLQPSPQTLGPRPQATGRPVTPANQRFRYLHLGPLSRPGRVFGVMPVAEFVELRGLTRCLGSECVVYRLPADEQDIEARARSFGLWKKATLREQFLHFEGVVCCLLRQWAGRPGVE